MPSNHNTDVNSIYTNSELIKRILHVKDSECTEFAEYTVK